MEKDALRVDLKRARGAMRRLEANPGDAGAVHEIVQSLSGRHGIRLLERIRRNPEGERLLRERPSFDPDRADLDALTRLPEGSFGHVLATWMIRHGFEPEIGEHPFTDDSDIGYMGRRLLQVHDFWHVLAGFNGDPAGELGFVAFSVGQTGTPGFKFILANVLWRSIRKRWREERKPWTPLIPYLWRAYRVGRRARFLPPLILEDYFPLPIHEVREDLGIEPLRRSLNPAALPPVAPPTTLESARS